MPSEAQQVSRTLSRIWWFITHMIAILGCHQVFRLQQWKTFNPWIRKQSLSWKFVETHLSPSKDGVQLILHCIKSLILKSLVISTQLPPRRKQLSRNTLWVNTQYWGIIRCNSRLAKFQIMTTRVPLIFLLKREFLVHNSTLYSMVKGVHYPDAADSHSVSASVV